MLKASFVEDSLLLHKIAFCKRHCLIVFLYSRLVGRELSKQQLQCCYNCYNAYNDYNGYNVYNYSGYNYNTFRTLVFTYISTRTP